MKSLIELIPEEKRKEISLFDKLSSQIRDLKIIDLSDCDADQNWNNPSCEKDCQDWHDKTLEEAARNLSQHLSIWMVPDFLTKYANEHLLCIKTFGICIVHKKTIVEVKYPGDKNPSLTMTLEETLGSAHKLISAAIKTSPQEFLSSQPLNKWLSNIIVGGLTMIREEAP